MKNSILTIAMILSVITAIAQCTPRVLPFNENFSGNPFGPCMSNTGGWVVTSAASQAGWDISSTNDAGGTAPEAQAYGNQANGGIPETISLISPPMNITNITAIAVSFKHALWVSDSGASGPQGEVVSLESSSDSINWMTNYNANYNATPTLSMAVQETRVVPISGLTGDSLYLRFSIHGVLFKVNEWVIDDINITGTVFTNVAEMMINNTTNVFPNPVKDNSILRINTSVSGTMKVAIYNSIGQVILEGENVTHSFPITKNELNAGMYFFRATINGEQVSNGKFVVE